MVMTVSKRKNGMRKMAKLRSRLGILIAEYNHGRIDKLTQKELAEIVGLSENTISRLVRSDFEAIEADTIEKLCTFFELDTIDELLVIVRD